MVSQEPRKGEKQIPSEQTSQHDSGSSEHNIPVPAIDLTPKAVEMVKKTRAKEGLGDAYALRVSVTGSGCSGCQYSLGFDSEQHEGDTVAAFDGVRVLVGEV